MKLNLHINCSGNFDAKFILSDTGETDVDGIAIIGKDGHHLFKICSDPVMRDTIVIQSSIRGVGLSVCPVSSNAVSVRNDT